MSQSMEPRVAERSVPVSTVRRRFAVIVPAYNEVENIPELVAELRATWERHGLDGEVVLVDDGSTDGTAERAEAEGWDRLKVVRHRRNFGKTEALVTGAEATDAEWLVLYDADLQHDTEEIPRYLEKLAEGWDIVTGRKVGRYEKAGVSSTYNRMSRALFKVPVSDLNSMKAFRREVLLEVPLRHDWHRFFVVIAYDRGFTVSEIDITLHPRRHGEAKYSARSRIVVGLLDLMAVAFFLFFSRRPMLFFGLSGLVTAGLGVLVGVVTIVLRIAQAMPPFGFRPLLYLVILLETLGFLLVGFGLVAEMMAQQHTELDNIRRRLHRDSHPGDDPQLSPPPFG
jgi:glycosyltransferase involved in cell wall biosynthesis